MYSIVVMAALTTSGEAPDFGRRGGCSGCSGGGYACSGCYGGCYGGGRHGRGGCSGCYGGGYGGCYGGYGGCSGGYGGGYGGCSGGYGGGYGGGCYGMVGYGGSMPTSTGYMAQAAPTASEANRATIVVNLPADATLTFNGTPTRSTSERRVFTTPPLEPGHNYTYTLTARVTRDGQTTTTTREVAVQPGRSMEVTLEIPTVTASARR